MNYSSEYVNNVHIVVYGNGVDWGKICLFDLEKDFGAQIINSPYPCRHGLYEKVSKIFFSPKYTRYIPKNLKKTMVDHFMAYSKINSNELVWLIIYDHNRLGNNSFFLNDIRDRYPNVRLIYIFTNIVKFSRARENNFVDSLNCYYDAIFAFDKLDSQKYSFEYNPLLYSKLPTYGYLQEDYFFYIGKAKDRFNEIIKVYERLVALGQKCKFFIYDVPYEKQLHHENITYNQYLPYEIVLQYIQKSIGLVDIIQGDSTGLTIKVCEAITYDKLLITTNANVSNEPFFDDRYIKIISNAEDIDSSFFENKKNVHYTDEDRYCFSAKSFVNKLNIKFGHGEHYYL